MRVFSGGMRVFSGGRTFSLNISSHKVLSAPMFSPERSLMYEDFNFHDWKEVSFKRGFVVDTFKFVLSLLYIG